MGTVRYGWPYRETGGTSLTMELGSLHLNERTRKAGRPSVQTSCRINHGGRAEFTRGIARPVSSPDTVCDGLRLPFGAIRTPVVSHDLSVVSALCDRVVVLYAGAVVEEAPATELYRRPKHP